tara:strand:+ start:7808 stop:9361 length:1554 start_codon:yes stop_codon:yes gene_type:complete
VTHAIQSIVIVGGGTAGWITAGTLAAKLKNEHATGFTITLVESPDVKPIGVGEGTWPTMRRTLKAMGIGETDFIQQCNVSFKQGAKFAKWVTGEEDDFYYHPLVLPQDFDRTNLARHWAYAPSGQSFSQAVSPQETVCELGLAPKAITTAEYASIINYAYHLDAGLFSAFLQQHCTDKLGVRHILDNVSHINSALNGDITSVSTAQNGDIKGDLFIDCTGFKSLLLGEHFKVGFKSCKDVLFVDQALAIHVPYDDENAPVASHTISTGQSAGWVWDIGLQNRRGVGHVYSSAHTSEERAGEELLHYIRQTGGSVNSADIRKIPLNPGHREKFWQRNCVAIGLSAGFLEPLEASSLLLVEISASMIAEQFPAMRDAMDVIAKRFNRTFLYRWERIIDFLKLHYMLTQRNDSDFWIDNRDPVTIPQSLQDHLTLWRYQPPWHNDFEDAVEVFPAASYQYVLYGMGFYTQHSALGLSDAYQQKAVSLRHKNSQQCEQMRRNLPTNRALLNKIHQYGLQKV